MKHSDPRNADRRKRARFALHRVIHYTLLNDGRVIGEGSGYTLNISSKGVAFTTSELLRPGSAVEISVSWPALLEGSCPLRLVAFGYVVRSTSGMVACSICKFEFRTQARVKAASQETGATDSPYESELAASA